MDKQDFLSRLKGRIQSQDTQDSQSYESGFMGELRKIREQYGIVNTKLDASLRSLQLEHVLRQKESRGELSDELSSFYAEQLKDLVQNTNEYTEDMMKVQMKRVKTMMKSIEKSDIEEKDFLLREYQKSIEFLEEQSEKRFSKLEKTKKFLSESAERYFDIKGIYSAFLGNNPLSMMAYDLISGKIKKHRERKEQERELVASDTHRLMMTTEEKRLQGKQSSFEKEPSFSVANDTMDYGDTAGAIVGSMQNFNPAQFDTILEEFVKGFTEGFTKEIKESGLGEILKQSLVSEPKSTPKAERVSEELESDRRADIQLEYMAETAKWQQEVLHILKRLGGKSGSNFGGGGVVTGSDNSSIVDSIITGKVLKDMFFPGKGKVGGKAGLFSKVTGAAKNSKISKFVGRTKVGQSAANTLKGSKISGMAKGLAGKILVPLGGALAAYNEYDEGGSVSSSLASGVGTMAGGAYGALAGQALIPIPVVGAIIGGVTGAFLGEEAMSALFGDEEYEKRNNKIIRDLESRGVIFDDGILFDDWHINKGMLNSLTNDELTALMAFNELPNDELKLVKETLAKKFAQKNQTKKEFNNMMKSISEPIKLSSDKQSKIIGELEKSGIYDKDYIGNSEIDVSKIKNLNVEQLSAILQDNDLDDVAMGLVKAEYIKKRTKQFTKKSKGKINKLDGTLGFVSEKYESRGDAGAIGYDRHGGASYGSYQLSSKQGTLQKFIEQSGYKDEFKGLKPGTSAFNEKWKELANANPEQFKKAQHDFIKRTHYDVTMKQLQNAGIDLSDRGKAVQEMLWSTSVQHGAGGAFSLIRKALIGKDINNMTQEDIINAVMDYKKNNINSLFRSSTDRVKRSVAARFEKEQRDLLQLASESKSTKSAEILAQAAKPVKPELVAQQANVLETTSGDIKTEQMKVASQQNVVPVPLNKPTVKRVAKSEGTLPNNTVVPASARNDDSTIKRISDRYISQSLA